jgi:GNAT superfamily N-acetyltransferase
MQIRPATLNDADAISALIKSVAHYFTLQPQGQGAEGFLQGIEPAAIAGYIAAPDFLYFVGEVDQQLAGLVALRAHRHLYHLFVGPAWQGRGLSRQLWQHALQVALAVNQHQDVTVNATPYAVPVYERFGFQPTGPRVKTKGIAFVPMAWHVRHAGQQPHSQ